MSTFAVEASKFCGLPPEIRMKIYRNVFSNLQNEEVDIFDCPSDKVAEQEPLKYRVLPHDVIMRHYNPAILYVNRQVYNEAHRLFYTLPLFKMTFSCLGPDEPTMLRPISLRDVQHVSVREIWLEKFIHLVTKGEFHNLKTIILRSIFIYFYVYSGALLLWPDLSVQDASTDEEQEGNSNGTLPRSISFGELNGDLIKSFVTERKIPEDTISISKTIPALEVRLARLRDVLSRLEAGPDIELYVKIYIQDWSDASPLIEGQTLLHHHKQSRMVVEDRPTPSIPVGFYNVGKDSLIMTNNILPWL